jgi:hypothetical protein
MGKKFPGVGDHRAAIGSEEYLKWLESLPDFLRDIVASERGITITAAAMRADEFRYEKQENDGNKELNDACR